MLVNGIFLNYLLNVLKDLEERIQPPAFHMISDSIVESQNGLARLFFLFLSLLCQHDPNHSLVNRVGLAVDQPLFFHRFQQAG